MSDLVGNPEDRFSLIAAHCLFIINFQVTDIWYTHLYGIVKVRTRTPATPKGVGPLIVERSNEIEDSLGMHCIYSTTSLGSKETDCVISEAVL